MSSSIQFKKRTPLVSPGFSFSIVSKYHRNYYSIGIQLESGLGYQCLHHSNLDKFSFSFPWHSMWTASSHILISTYCLGFSWDYWSMMHWSFFLQLLYTIRTNSTVYISLLTVSSDKNSALIVRWSSDKLKHMRVPSFFLIRRFLNT